MALNTYVVNTMVQALAYLMNVMNNEWIMNQFFLLNTRATNTKTTAVKHHIDENSD